MAFLNASMLLAIAAAGIPILLHLFGRRKPKRQTFPAVRLISAAFESNRRRFRVRHWLLLLLRVLVVAGVALAFAQPIVTSQSLTIWMSIGIVVLLGVLLTGSGAWSYVKGKSQRVIWGLYAVGLGLLLVAAAWAARTTASEPQPQQRASRLASIAILVDNSARIAFLNGNESRLEHAQRWADWILDQHDGASRFAIADRGLRPVTFSIDQNAARRVIDRWEVIENPLPLERKISEAVQVVRESELEQKAVFILSDLTEQSWNEISPLAGPNLEQDDIQFYVIDIGDEESPNRRIGELHLSAEMTSESLPTSVAFLVESNADSPAEEVDIELRIYDNSNQFPVLRDGQIVYPQTELVDRRTLPLQPSSQDSVVMEIPGFSAGVHHGFVAFREKDRLDVDDRRYFTIEVSPPQSVLLACDDGNEARVLKEALSLSEFAGGGGVDYRVKTIGLDELSEVDFAVFDVVGVVDPYPLADTDWLRFVNWIERGGRGFIVLGPALDRRDGPESSREKETVLRLPQLVDIIRSWRVPSPGRFLRLRPSSHPVASALDAFDAPWQDFPVYRYWQVEPSAEETVIANYSGTDHPFAVDRSIGSGRVMIFTTPLPALSGASLRWNDLFSQELPWPAWQFIRQAAAYLSNRDAGSLNVRLGQPVGLPHRGEAMRYQLFAPASPPTAIDTAEGRLLPGIPKTAGNYWLRSPRGNRGYSANLLSGATEMERTTDEKVKKLFGDRCQLVRRREAVQLSSSDGTVAEPLYGTLLLIVSLAFLLEQFVANRHLTRALTVADHSKSARRKRAFWTAAS